MTRSRNVASALALLILLVLLLALLQLPVPYAIYRPGPTFDVLAKSGKTPIIDVSGHRTYRDDGQLRMVTIIPSQPQDRISVLDAVTAWLNPKDDLYPASAVFQQNVSNAQENEQDQLQMVSSQDTATAAALHQLGIKYTKSVRAGSVKSGAPADGKIHVGDLILAVDGVSTHTPDAVVKQVQRHGPGETLHFRIDRGGKVRTVAITTIAAGTTGKLSKEALVGVGVTPTYRFPFQVKLHVASTIGGPSAGTMFALGIYDLLTPGSLTGGQPIAGTGTITADGQVGAIGGIQQKIAGAQADGAKLFLVPATNCDEAVRADYDSDKMRLVKVSTLSGAIRTIKAWTKDPASKTLPECAS
ncbi:MAG TPA: PDZ domain-containing protein [Marmoricola sp.]